MNASIAGTIPTQTELQLQYQNYKSTLQSLAQKIGDVEQEAEEHKYVRLLMLSI
jgi:prefoldin subunit 2